MNNNQKIRITVVLLVIAAAIWAYIAKPIKYGLDLQGGTQLILQAKETAEVKVYKDSMEGAIEIIRNRIDGLGITEPVIQRKQLDQIIVELPGIEDPDKLIADLKQALDKI